LDDAYVWLIVGLCALFIVVLLSYKFFTWMKWVSREVRYLNREIRRAPQAEKKHWIRRKRRLVWSWLPFVKYR